MGPKLAVAVKERMRGSGVWGEQMVGNSQIGWARSRRNRAKPKSREGGAEGAGEANESGGIETGRMVQTEGDCSSTGQIEPRANAEVVATIQIAKLAHNEEITLLYPHANNPVIRFGQMVCFQTKHKAKQVHSVVSVGVSCQPANP
jgi:hypothetical protein